VSEAGHGRVSAEDVARDPESEHSQDDARRAYDVEGESMTRTEKLVTAAVLVVNLSIGFVLIDRSDSTDTSELVRSDPLTPGTVAALSPMSEVHTIRVSPAVASPEAVRVGKR
jgi:hypothetical protein